MRLCSNFGRVRGGRLIISGDGRSRFWELSKSFLLVAELDIVNNSNVWL